MIRFTTGNLLESGAEALVNTVNTVGVMGKGIALMFKEAFPDNYAAYKAACGRGEVQVGRMFVTERRDLHGPRWIINFPTKQHWRQSSRLEWVVEGLRDLHAVIQEIGAKSVAVPPLGAGNGSLDWALVKPEIKTALETLNVEVIVFEPSRAYHNVAKRTGIERLTPGRALVAEVVRIYGVLGFDCSMLEVQKLVYFLQSSIDRLSLPDQLGLQFSANRYGPYSDKLRHLLEGLDGSYLHCECRIGDSGPLDAIWFDQGRKEHVQAYLTTPAARPFRAVLHDTAEVIDGFQSPLGLEVLATVDWLLHHERCDPTVEGIEVGLRRWPTAGAAERKLRIFEPHMIELALERLVARRPTEEATTGAA